MASTQDALLEEQIGQWRAYLKRRQAIHAVDVAELEDHLREQVNGLRDSGLAADEAFLVAVKRMGDLDALSREFAREHSDRLWKQLVMPQSESASAASATREGIVAFLCATAAAISIKLPELFGVSMEGHEVFYAHNAPVFVLAFLTAFFVWKRNLAASWRGWLAGVFAVAALFANVYPFAPQGYTATLSILHTPMALWFAVGVAYAGSRWALSEGRMDFIRFSGELFIYYSLIAFGGGVFTGFTVMIFDAIGMKADTFVGHWLIPCGAAGAVIIGSWLVEAKQSVIENMAPVLTRIFTPLFTALLLTFLGTMLITGRSILVERQVLIGFDLLLAMVVGLLLYAISARDSLTPPGFFDWLQVVLVVAALLADVVALTAIGSRISEFGFSPNRVAALGENLILLVNLAGSAVLYVRFLRGRGAFADLERWQTNYLPVYAVWAAFVALAFPPIFGYR